MLANATALPTLSQVQSMDTAYLPEAADYWERTGNLWDDAFTTIHERMSTPGGVRWKGLAAKQEWERSYTDMIKVRPVVSQLHEAAGIARRADEALQALRAEALLAVRDASADGFDVGEDYSVTDRSTNSSAEFRAARQTAAKAHSAFIRHRVAALVAKDSEITTQIAETTAGVGNLTFVEAPGVDSPVKDKHNGVQLVDNKTWKQDPPPTIFAGCSTNSLGAINHGLERSVHRRIFKTCGTE
jgi:hypothetical protein